MSIKSKTNFYTFRKDVENSAFLYSVYATLMETHKILFIELIKLWNKRDLSFKKQAQHESNFELPELIAELCTRVTSDC